jgi:hypothetical protein
MAALKLDLDEVVEASGELARYQVPIGERVLLAYPGPGGVQILDVPANGSGDCFFVDRGYDGAVLHAFVQEYVGQARRLGCPPMSSRALDSIIGLSEEGLAGVLADSIQRV